MTDEKGWIYTLHFSKTIGGKGRNGAGHYTGWARWLIDRVMHHRNGTSGARIMEALHRMGIDFVVADVIAGTRTDERRLKNHGAARRCPVCRGVSEGIADLTAWLAQQSTLTGVSK